MQKDTSKEKSNKNEIKKEGKERKNEGQGNETNEDNMCIFDEPDDELEEFEEMGSIALNVDTELENWDEDWCAAGWDDEGDEDDKFISRVEAELKNFKADIDANNGYKN